MQSTSLVSSFAEIAREKDIDRDNLQLIVQDVFRTMIKMRYGADDETAFQIVFNPDNGDIQVIHVRTVVDNYAVEDPVTEVELAHAHRIDDSLEPGDDVAEDISIADFGRRAVLMARQTFAQRIRDIEKDNVFEEYVDMVGDIVIGEVYQTRRNQVLVLHERTELILPKEEQISRDRYRKGEMIRAVVKAVERDPSGNPQVIISRADPMFMERLFEQEVPEIYDRIVQIKGIVRQPGERAKVTVVSTDERIDPVGACVGMKGVRIHAVARELANEGIDIIPWSPKDEEMVRRALTPSKPISVELTTDQMGRKRAKVTIRADEVSQAIGKGGLNIKLASQLTGYEIDIFRESQDEDVDLREFSDELPADVIERFYEVGLDSARSVLAVTPEEIARRTGFELADAERIQSVIRSEFEDEAG